MGGGCYSYMRDIKTKLSNSSQSREQVFSQRSMNPDMDIKNKVRECRDSEEHPETLPIIIALDVTGSMGMIPHKLITSDFPEIMKKIMDEGIAHPQVCFLGIGDQYSDYAPIQGGQFESSDELLDKWLKTIWLEGHGGGNGGESYQLAWWSSGSTYYFQWGNRAYLFLFWKWCVAWCAYYIHRGGIYGPHMSHE